VIRQGMSYCCFLEGFTLSTGTSCRNSETEPAKVESSCRRRKTQQNVPGPAMIYLSETRETQCKRITECPVLVFFYYFQSSQYHIRNYLSKPKEYSLERLELAKKHERLPHNILFYDFHIILLQAILLTKSFEIYQLRRLVFIRCKKATRS